MYANNAHASFNLLSRLSYLNIYELVPRLDLCPHLAMLFYILFYISYM